MLILTLRSNDGYQHRGQLLLLQPGLAGSDMTLLLDSSRCG